MITLRLHPDDCGPDNGPLRVIPGSHREGRVRPERIKWWQTDGEVVECHGPAGGALLMRPLLLHSSSPARQPAHRRVLHVEFAKDAWPERCRGRSRRFSVLGKFEPSNLGSDHGSK
jgi:ectoine hydroxylase-related dioxygenase (phytanoyl-CoA dioxygenase family)